MYKAKPLKFSFNALEPYLSEETVRRHYIIYTNYVKRLNDLIENNKYTLEETIKNIDEFPMENRDKILFLSSAILNHELYFENIGLNKSEPMGKLKQKIEQLKIKIPVKTGASDKVFGSVSTKTIHTELSNKGIKIDKKKIHLEEPISSLGFHNIEINLHKKVTAILKIELTRK